MTTDRKTYDYAEAMLADHPGLQTSKLAADLQQFVEDWIADETAPAVQPPRDPYDMVALAHRVCGMPPVPALAADIEVLEREKQEAVMSRPDRWDPT
jgi:hypothetical protein